MLHFYAALLVLLAAVFHASWNALLKGGLNPTQFMRRMSLVMGIVALSVVPFCPSPDHSCWHYIAASAILHLGYNVLLLKSYAANDFGSAYPVARGLSPLLVTLGSSLVLRHTPAFPVLCGIVLISLGIISLSLSSRMVFLPVLATGMLIAAYTVVDSMGVQRSGNTLSYTAWIFLSYLLMPLVLPGPKNDSPRSSLSWKPVFAGLLSLSAYSIVLWACRHVEVGIVSAIRETSVLWALLIGYLWLHERMTLRRTVSAGVVFAGAALLVLKSL